MLSWRSLRFFKHVASMTASAAAQLSQTIEIIVRGGQWGNSSHNTAPTASTGLTTPRRGHALEKAIGQNATSHSGGVCPRWLTTHVGDAAEAVEREGRGLWGKTGQRSLERSASVACDREKAGNEGPVLADIVEKVFSGWRPKIPRAADASSARRRKGPNRFIQNRSRTSVVALKSDAAAEKSEDRLSRDF
jgi:hypothetical protein